jgi:hypothetical protein
MTKQIRYWRRPAKTEAISEVRCRLLRYDVWKYFLWRSINDGDHNPKVSHCIFFYYGVAQCQLTRFASGRIVKQPPLEAAGDYETVWQRAIACDLLFDQHAGVRDFLPLRFVLSMLGLWYPSLEQQQAIWSIDCAGPLTLGWLYSLTEPALLSLAESHEVRVRYPYEAASGLLRSESFRETLPDSLFWTGKKCAEDAAVCQPKLPAISCDLLGSDYRRS